MQTSLAQQQIQQKRIERIKAVRSKAKRISKQKAAQFSELQTAAQHSLEDEIEKNWQTQKEQKLQRLKAQYEHLQSQMGSAHIAAQQTTTQMQKQALQHRDELEQHQIVTTQRARSAMSILQRRIVNEQNSQQQRAQWRLRALQLVEHHRHRLEQQLNEQYFLLPAGLSPQNPFQQHQPQHSDRIQLIHTSTTHSRADPRFYDAQRYTLVTKYNRTGNLKHYSEPISPAHFNPHPKLSFQKVSPHQSGPTAEANSAPSLKQYLPQTLLKRLNRKYHEKRKKKKRRRKQKQRWEAQGITLKSDGSKMTSIPEEPSQKESMFHAMPSNVQHEQREALRDIGNTESQRTHIPTPTPWDAAKEVRAATALKERAQTQAFLTAQKRGKAALERELRKGKAKQLDAELEMLHQQMIQQKLAKCRHILEKAGERPSKVHKLQAELEGKFEDLFVRSVTTSPRSDKENATAKSESKETEESDSKDEEKPRLVPPRPVCHSDSSSSSTSLSTTAESSPQKPKAIKLPPIKKCEIHEPIVNQPRREMETEEDIIEQSESESEEEYEESDIAEQSVTRSRCIKFKKNDDGSTSISESTSMSSSMASSPQKGHRSGSVSVSESESEAAHDRVVVPKQWFESLLAQIKADAPSTTMTRSTTASNSILSSPQTVKEANLVEHRGDQIAMDRTWFEKLMRDVYHKNVIAEPQKKKANVSQDVNLTEILSRDTATNSEAEAKSTTDSSSVVAEDEYNRFFKRQKPISVLADLVSDVDVDGDNDADDEYDPTHKPYNLRQSIESTERNGSDPLDIDETSRFIRESAALLNKTANFFENFSDTDVSSMDYKKTDQSLVDKLLRASIGSIHSDSSNWSLSSLSSADFQTLPSSLARFDQFLSIGENGNGTKKIDAAKDGLNTKVQAKVPAKTPMQTIKEIATPTSSALSNASNGSSFTFDSKSNSRKASKDSRIPDTPKLFGASDGSESSSTTFGENTNPVNGTQKIQDASPATQTQTPATLPTQPRHREANIQMSDAKIDYHSDEEKAVTVSRPSSADNGYPPQLSDAQNTEESNTETPKASKNSELASRPRFTDGTLFSAPSLPPSASAKSQSRPAKTAPSQQSRQSRNGPSAQSAAGGASQDQSALPIQHLHFLDVHLSGSSETPSLTELKKFNEEMDSTLQEIMKLETSRNEGDISFLQSMDSSARPQIPSALDSLNVSEIENSSSNSHPQHFNTNKSHVTSGTSDLSFSLDTLYAGHRLLMSEEQPRRTTFPPITPMDLLDSSSDPESLPTTKGSPSALETVSTAINSESCSECSQDDDDMELEVEDLVSSAMVRQQYGDGEVEVGTDAELSTFGAMGADGSHLQTSQGSESGVMLVGDLEMVREEAESDFKPKVDEVVEAQSQSETRRSYQQIQIGNKLAKLKSRGKQRRAR